LPEGKRKTVCFLLSLNAHIWLVGLFSLQLLPPVVEYREISLIRLPEKAAESRAATATLAAKSEPSTVRPLFEKQPPKVKPEPRVSMKISRSFNQEKSQQELKRSVVNKKPVERTAPQAMQTAHLEAPELKFSLQATFTLPTAEQLNSKKRQAQVSHQPFTAAAHSSADSIRQTVTVQPPETLRDPQDIQAFGNPRHREGELLSPLEIIQARIDAVTPLVQRSNSACRANQGVARVKFRMNVRGYKEEHLITRTSGSHCLDEQIEEILHLAEPYPYLAGWVPVEVKFRY